MGETCGRGRYWEIQLFFIETQINGTKIWRSVFRNKKTSFWIPLVFVASLIATPQLPLRPNTNWGVRDSGACWRGSGALTHPVFLFVYHKLSARLPTPVYIRGELNRQLSGRRRSTFLHTSHHISHAALTLSSALSAAADVSLDVARLLLSIFLIHSENNNFHRFNKQE